MQLLRTRFGKDIVAEFLPPAKPSTKVIIFLSGMPSMPRLASTLEYYSKKGFWVFHPRFRGSWESSGSFLQYPPETDVQTVINRLPKGFKDFGSGKMYRVSAGKLYLFGSSFGGPAALLNSADSRVTAVVTVSSVIDWREENKMEPLGPQLRFIKDAYGQGYRLTKKNWKKLGQNRFYNPITQLVSVNGKKVLLFQAKDDPVVGYRPTQQFAKLTGSELVLYRHGGHFGSASFGMPKFYKKIKSFLKIIK